MNDTSSAQTYNSGQSDDFGDSDEYQDFMTIVLDRLTSLATGLVDLIGKNSLLAAGTLAGLVGAAIGVRMANRSKSRAARLGGAIGEQAEQLRDRVGKVGKGSSKPFKKATDYGELLSLGMKLLENPIVRAFVVQQVTRSFTKRFK